MLRNDAADGSTLSEMTFDTGDIIRFKIWKGALGTISDEMVQRGTYQMEFMGLCPKQMFSSWESCGKKMHPNASNGQISIHMHTYAHTHTHRNF